MHIMHLALGGCLKAPPVQYGITEDTGGHVRYVLGAALAQARRPDVRSVTVVTRRFMDRELGLIHAQRYEPLGPRARIVRLSTRNPGYLEKAALTAELEPFIAALLDMVAIKGPPPDVVHAHFADAAEAAFALRDVVGMPVIYHSHSLARDGMAVEGAPDGPPRPALAARLRREARALREADAIIASSRDEAERQIPAYPGAALTRVHRVPPGVEPTEKCPGAAAPEALLGPFLRYPARPLILAIARPVRKKNLPALLEAYATTPGLSDRANLAILAGLRTGPESGGVEQREVIGALLAGIDRHNLWGSVAVPKQHDEAGVSALYAHAAALRGVFVNPALVEPFGLTTIEAAAAGLPVIATRNGGAVDIVGDYGHGVLIDPTNIAAMGRAIQDLIGNELTWRRLSQAGVRAVARSGGWHHWAEVAMRISRDAIRLRQMQRQGLRVAQTVGCVGQPGTAKESRFDNLLTSDIDGTLTGDVAAAARFSEWRHRSPGWGFAVATGRSLPEARHVLARWSLPDPEIFITSVGSEIYWRNGAGWLDADEAYADKIATDWDADAVEAVMREVAGQSSGRLVPQRGLEQRRFKRSYLGEGDDMAKAAGDALAAAGVPARVVYSHHRLLDILPARAGKGAALEHVAERLGLPLSACVVAGDSGNDICLLGACPRAIVVANHTGELTRDLTAPQVYWAKQPYADGVLAGMDAFERAEPARVRS